MSDTATLLTYKVTSTPETMHVGELVMLSISVSNVSPRAIECKSIRFDFPKGNSSQALFSDETGITQVASSADWKIQPQGTGFIATPKSGTAKVQGSLTFDLRNVKVNNQPGFVELTITEETGTGHTASKKISIGKFPADQTTLLTYEVSHTPDPLQASPQQGDGRPASLTVAVSNSTHQSIDCRSISFGFAAGSNAKDFFEKAAGIETSVPAGWSISQSDGLFTATPDTGRQSISAAGLHFGFSNITVNQQVGTTDLTITEITGPGPNTATLTIPLGKFPLDFEVSDLTVDRANVTAGDNVTLSWIGSSDATYELEYLNDESKLIKVPGQKTDPPLPADGSYRIANLQTAGAQTTDVDFTLNVKRSGSGDRPQVIQRQCTVTVAPLLPRVNYFEGVSLEPRNSKVFVKWDSSNADSCRLVDGNFDPSSDKHRLDFEDDDQASKRFTLTALDLTKKHHNSLDLIVNWRLEEIQSTAVAPVGSSTYGLAVAASEDRIFVADSGEGGDATLRVFDSGTMDRIGAIPSSGTRSLQVTSDHRLYGATGWGEFFYLSLEDVQLTQQTSFADTQQYGLLLAISAGNNVGFASWSDFSNDKKSHVQEYLMEPGIWMGPPTDVNTRVISIAASTSAAQRYYLGCADQTLRICSGNVVGDPLQLSGVPVGIACSLDGKFIYVVTGDRKLLALNADTLTPFADSTPLQASPTAIAVAPNGEHLYITTDDGKLRKFLAYSMFNPVKIVSFAATPEKFETADANDSFQTQLSWETVSATEVRVNNEVIAEGGKSVWIDKTTEFTLVAKGGGGPVSQTQIVQVIKPVKIDHFTPGAVMLYRVGSNVDVTLDWATSNADQVTLNGDVVQDRGSKIAALQQTTKFSLAATGEGGPVTSDLTVVVKEINLVVSRSDSAILVTFSADAGTYSVKFEAHYFEGSGASYTNRTEESTVVVTSAGDNQPLSAQTPLHDRFPEYYCTGAEVTVTGLPCGPISAKCA
jgi:hypothetical protein